MDIYIKNGTPVDGAPLCETCSRGFIARGYRETELVVVCQALYPERRMRFPVRICSGYIEKNKPSIREMEEIAVVLDRVALKRDAGFVRIEEPGKGGEKIELILDSEKQ
jgi:hypothetical protein